MGGLKSLFMNLTVQSMRSGVGGHSASDMSFYLVVYLLSCINKILKLVFVILFLINLEKPKTNIGNSGYHVLSFDWVPLSFSNFPRELLSIIFSYIHIKSFFFGKKN